MTLQHFLRCARVPFAFAIACSLYATVISTATGGAALDRLRLSLSMLIAMYFLVALGVAIGVALFGSWAKTRLRGAILGFLIAAFLAVAINFSLGPAVVGGALSGYKLVLYVIFLGLMPGAFAGALYSRDRE